MTWKEVEKKEAFSDLRYIFRACIRCTMEQNTVTISFKYWTIYSNVQAQLIKTPEFRR